MWRVWSRVASVVTWECHVMYCYVLTDLTMYMDILYRLNGEKVY